jgi:cystathionine gamma-synthase
MSKKPTTSWKARTLAAQALGAVDPATGAVVPPVHVATTYLRDPDNQYRAGFAYGRADNATVRQGERVIAALEEADDALLFGSGMSAATAAVMALPEPSHIVASKVMYWALRHWLTTEAPRFGHRVDIVDTSNLAAVRQAVKRGRTKLVWIETPGNPLWTITDIAAISEIAHVVGAVLCIDSTWPHRSLPGRLGWALILSCTRRPNILIEHRASIEGEGPLSRLSAQAVRGARRCRRTLSRSDQSALGRR